MEIGSLLPLGDRLVMTYDFLTSIDWNLQADSQTGVKVEKQAKIDQVMGPQTWLTFESP